jgi:hypothetical protein
MFEVHTFSISGFCPENGGSKFFRNSGNNLPEYINLIEGNNKM